MVSCGDGDDKSKTKPTKNSLAVDLSDTSNHASGSHFYSQSFSGNYYFKLLSFYDYEFYLTILDIFSSNNSRATYKTDRCVLFRMWVHIIFVLIFYVI